MQIQRYERPLPPPTARENNRTAARAALCAHYGVKNTGRQWRKLRRALKRKGYK